MATVAAPIDATSTAAWKALEAHQEKLEAEGIDLKAWFAADAERVNKLSFDAGDLHFDLSKNLVTDETVKLLCDLAREVKLEERRDAMFSGEHINTTEDRAVLHTALRRPASEKGQLIVDGQDVVADVHEVLDACMPSPSACAPVSGRVLPAKRSSTWCPSASAAPIWARSWPTRPCVPTPTPVLTAATSPTSTPTIRQRSSRASIPRPRS